MVCLRTASGQMLGFTQGCQLGRLAPCWAHRRRFCRRRCSLHGRLQERHGSICRCGRVDLGAGSLGCPTFSALAVIGARCVLIPTVARDSIGEPQCLTCPLGLACFRSRSGKLSLPFQHQCRQFAFSLCSRPTHAKYDAAAAHSSFLLTSRCVLVGWVEHAGSVDFSCHPRQAEHLDETHLFPFRTFVKRVFATRGSN